jgi:hypothetical protein
MAKLDKGIIGSCYWEGYLPSRVNLCEKYFHGNERNRLMRIIPHILILRMSLDVLKMLIKPITSVIPTRKQKVGSPFSIASKIEW